MTWLVACLMLNPTLGFLILSVAGKFKERLVSKFLAIAVFLQWIFSILLTILWFQKGATPIEQLMTHVYQHGDFKFSLYYLVDHVSVAGLLTVTTIFLLVTRFSRYYLHKDPGYQRYFAILELFLAGLTILMLAGNIDFLFAGWEFLGVSSFLLIGFYHHRLSAIRNSLFVYGIYRFTDIGLILGAWLKKSFFQDSHRFLILQQIAGSQLLESFHPHVDWALSSLILLSAIGKSAQFPISFWLSRAMEGPTSSSAIFYGALSLHAGVFLLLRTYQFWFLTWEARLIVFGIGLLTVIFAGLASQSQANIKGRLAYAGCFHVGLQFIELSLGFPNLALAHVIGHMIVRCYQFLISPAVVTYGLRAQNIAIAQKPHTRDRMFFAFPKKIQKTLYVFSLNEGYLEALIEKLLLRPFKRVSELFSNVHLALLISAGIFALCTLTAALFHFSSFFQGFFAWLGAGLMLALCTAAFGEKNSFFLTWNSVGLSNFMFGLFILFVTQGHLEMSPWFLLSIFGFWLLGLVSLKMLFQMDTNPSLKKFYALADQRPSSAHFFLIAFLGIAGFPLFPSFLGEDIILHGLVGPYSPFALLGVLVLMLNGMTAAKLYTRACWGPTSTV